MGRLKSQVRQRTARKDRIAVACNLWCAHDLVPRVIRFSYKYEKWLPSAIAIQKAVEWTSTRLDCVSMGAFKIFPVPV